MNRLTTLALLAVMVLLSTLALLSDTGSGWLIALAGLFFVVGGTLVTTLLSEGYPRLRSVARQLAPALRGEEGEGLGEDQSRFLQLAEAYRRGRVHQAELHNRRIADPFLRQGAQLVIDRCARAELERVLLLRITKAREEARRQVKVLHAMGGLAPAFGMLGTLLGLLRLLFSLGDGGLAAIGQAMGFAMITTVYGLVAANLLIRPLATKLEHRANGRLSGLRLRYELLLMLFERESPVFIRDALQEPQGPRGQAAPAPEAPSAGIQLASAG